MAVVKQMTYHQFPFIGNTIYLGTAYTDISCI